jgi:hypothetical protein
VDAAAADAIPTAATAPARPADRPVAPPPAATPPPAAATPVPAAPAAVPAPPDRITLTLTPDALCWVRAVADGRVAFEGLLTRGATETITASRTLSFTVGDAGVCRYTLNGRPGRALGRAGQVVTARVTPDTVREMQQ